MTWSNLLWKMRMERAPQCFAVSCHDGRTWVHDMSAWVDDWLSRTWGARNLTAVILGAR